MEAFLNADGDVPGEKIENVRVSPPKLFLRDNKGVVLLSIPTASLTPGPLWICITETPSKKKAKLSSVGN